MAFRANIKSNLKMASAIKTIFVLAGFLSLSSSYGHAATEVWNPAPAEDDVIFSLPCEQKIVFRRIVTQELGEDHSDILDDRRIRLGSSDRQKAYIDYLRTGFIAGHFAIDRKRFFLLGKYETTAAQYKSLASAPECRIDARDEDMPASRLSWYNAVDFSRKLTSHLLSNQKTELQNFTGTTKVHARLPTEIEWEFAARGGLAVSAADFQGLRAPMTGDIKGYVWFNDPQSARGELQPIGLLNPNPLGLHDVYGNVAEMMLEPFTLNKAGRSHGLAGGLILKGGSFQSNANYITSAGREEDSFFDETTGEEKRRRNTGFRIALVGVALPTSDDVDQLANEWNAASQSTLPASDDPMALIANMRETNSDLTLARELDAVEQAIRTEIAAGSERRSQLLTGLLVNVGKTIADIRTRYRGVKNRTTLLKPEMAGALDENALQSLKARVAEDQSVIQDLNYFGHDAIVRMVENYEIDQLENQARIAAAELRQRNLDDIADGVAIASQIASVLKRGEREYNREDVLSFTLSGL
jgi:hypothetical protein